MARSPAAIRNTAIDTSNPPFAVTRWPANAVAIWKMDRIKPYANNPKLHPPEQIDLLARIMSKHGVDQPIVIDEDGVILKGHGRRLAAIKAGFEEFPVAQHFGLSETDKRAMRIVDNQINLMTGYDPELIRLEVGALKLVGYDLNMLAFSQVQLKAMIAPSVPEDAAAEIPPPKNPVSRLGDVWLLGNHRLVCGDSTNAETVAIALDGKRPGIMVTDPPYGVDYDPAWRNTRGSLQSNGTRHVGKRPSRAIGEVLNDDRADWTEAWELFPGNVAYVWCASMTNDTVIASLEQAGFVRRSHIVWAKNHITIGRSDYHWKHEACWYAVRKGATGNWQSDRKQTTVWDDIDKPQKSESGHSTQKPIECMKRPIENNSKFGDLVYEPFSGSGTTILAGEITGRKVIAIELKPAFVDVAVIRWEQQTGQKAILAATGATYAETGQSRRVKPERALRSPAAPAKPAKTQKGSPKAAPRVGNRKKR